MHLYTNTNAFLFKGSTASSKGSKISMSLHTLQATGQSAFNLLKTLIDNLNILFCTLVIDLSLHCAYHLQKSVMNNLRDIDETPSAESLEYFSAVESLEKLGISGKEKDKSDTPLTSLQNLRRRRPILFRRYNSAPITSTPITGIDSVVESRNRTQLEGMVERLSIDEEQECQSARGRVFTKDDALAIRMTMSRGGCDADNKTTRPKIYYQAMASKSKAKRLGLLNMESEKREYYHKYNTLNCVPFILLNRNVLIDLRDETSIAGKLVDADGFMNISLVDAIFTDQKGNYHEMENFSVLSRYIRYIHIPEDIKVIPEIQNFLDEIGGKKKRNTEPQKKTFKLKRAQANHQRTLRELASESSTSTKDS